MTGMKTLVDGPAGARHNLLFAHGAGAGMEHDFMVAVALGVAERGICVVRFEFPYMQKRREDGKRRPPDRMPKLLEAYRAQLAELPADAIRVVGGKSMGGRVASLLAAETRLPQAVHGVVCLGFPFHPPGKPDNYRGEHLAEMATPTLILQGERDPFGTRTEVEGYSLSSAVRCDFLLDGEHGFKPRKRSGATLEQNLERAVTRIGDFIHGLGG